MHLFHPYDNLRRELALAMDIGWNSSYMQVINGIEGEVLLDRWNYTNKARLACDIQRLEGELTPRAAEWTDFQQLQVNSGQNQDSLQLRVWLLRCP